ncbi:vanadium-dependent haloperoxidase [Alteromonas ponticola]|uniref:Vanadium-dependent haloperoxidase n=1 Tax=Alteromonas aquimaris TaxID=2998417 RepID=A0ABT3P3N3_9ALTE|nr:vanadium-dependent haloperoxidase [Alteromonas aquimaris]MCW8107160.1 vanadium-dependent haloperoxidase [Alteromonas aquimaris]
MNTFNKASLLATLTLLILTSISKNAHSFDFDNGNAPAQIVIPTIIPVILQDVSPGAGDATLVLRNTILVTNAWFDAIAPYHPTAIGIYSQFDHRMTESTNREKNIAILYASYHVMLSLQPQRMQTWRAMLEDLGLDPDLDTDDTSTPEGLGIVAGKNVVFNRQNDGMNQLGNIAADGEEAKYNPVPYLDYTGYSPKNSPTLLLFPSKWQPALVSSGTGLFKAQHFVTPQLKNVTPYSYKNPRKFRAPKPTNSNVINWAGYIEQAQQVLYFSANLTEEQKMKAEFFDNKFRSLGFSAVQAAQLYNLNLMDFVHFDFLVNVAAFDTSIAIWQEKYRHDAVRPFSAIGYIWGDKHVSSWGGPRQGTVIDMPANQWKSYMPVADHPEYPSASASFCAAHAIAARKYLGSDNLNWTIPIPQGSSVVEPGFSPAADTELYFDTWTDFSNDCGDSRVWAGVHFPDAVPSGQKIGREIGGIAYDFVMGHINGDVN